MQAILYKGISIITFWTMKLKICTIFLQQPSTLKITKITKQIRENYSLRMS